MTTQNIQSLFPVKEWLVDCNITHVVIYKNAFLKSLWFMDAVVILLQVKAQTVWIVGWKYCETWHVVELCQFYGVSQPLYEMKPPTSHL